MRTIEISTETFAAIWGRRQPGEETEDAILKRILGIGTKVEPVMPEGHGKESGGVVDQRNGVNFPEGFRIFRRYKGREYEAEARQGSWVRMDDQRRFPTINQLNASIAAGAENVWNGNWKFRDVDGQVRSIGVLRR
ncbi:MAG: hypothetical protein JO276_03140 [Sphingomonadaceae bacterium]|nr:hypothetical protein [Sphingomonadaceae bacterium]